MDYTESLDYIHSFLKFGINPGLDRIRELLSGLGNPQNRLKFIHVAGTNGKGSVCNMISSILQASGYTTGLFTSPYVTDFRERIQINSAMIKKEKLAEIVTLMEPVISSLTQSGLQPTEFEVITAAAIKYFYDQKCDIVVLETGLGGTFDATNIIDTPLLSVLTSISFDHTDILGDTIEKIAAEKCGIIKENGVTVSYPQQLPEADKIIRIKAREKNNLFAGCSCDDIIIKNMSENGLVFSFDCEQYKLNLLGKHQAYNAVTAILASRELIKQGFDIPSSCISMGLQSVVLPARMEIVSKNPAVILDGSHNAQGIDALVHLANTIFPDTSKLFVMGTMSDKDYEYTIGKVASISCEFIATTPCNPRSLRAEIALRTAKKHCPSVKAIDSAKEAVAYGVDKARENGCALFICGSLYLAGEIREYLLKMLH